MSVGLRPAVRCSFDEEQGVLRIALKEAVSHGGAVDASGKPQVVLYALKVRLAGAVHLAASER